MRDEVMDDQGFDQLITNLERYGAPGRLPPDWAICTDDDVLRDIAPAARPAWLKKAKAEVVRRAIQERIKEVAEASEAEDEVTVETLLTAFQDDIKNFDLSLNEQRGWIKEAFSASL